jgi:hypothetical protein
MLGTPVGPATFAPPAPSPDAVALEAASTPPLPERVQYCPVDFAREHRRFRLTLEGVVILFALSTGIQLWLVATHSYLASSHPADLWSFFGFAEAVVAGAGAGICLLSLPGPRELRLESDAAHSTFQPWKSERSQSTEWMDARSARAYSHRFGPIYVIRLPRTETARLGLDLVMEPALYQATSRFLPQTLRENLDREATRMMPSKDVAVAPAE